MKHKHYFLFIVALLSFKNFSQATQATNAISSTSYLGTSNNNDVVFKRNGTEIGKLTTNSTSLGVNSKAVNNSISIGTDTGMSSNGSNNLFIGNNAGSSNEGGNNNIFIGNSAGYYLHDGSNNVYLGVGAGADNDGSNNVFIGFYAGETESVNNKLFIENSSSSNPLIWGDFAQDQLKFNAKVGIGGNSTTGFGNYPTTAGSVNVSNYNLFVKGGILTEEVRVSLNSTWADYVFHKDYNLKSLEEVEQFITENGHLPNVPSAKQVKEDGIELGEMAKIQQEKIEELTLYIIEQNKEIEKLKTRIKEIETLKKMINEITHKE